MITAEELKKVQTEIHNKIEKSASPKMIVFTQFMMVYMILICIWVRFRELCGFLKSPLMRMAVAGKL